MRTLGLSSLDFGQIALSHLLAQTSEAASVPLYNEFPARKGQFPARARAVIQLVRISDPSQMNLFDPKPLLAQYADQPHPDGVEIHQPGNTNSMGTLTAGIERRAAWTFCADIITITMGPVWETYGPRLVADRRLPL